MRILAGQSDEELFHLSILPDDGRWDPYVKEWLSQVRYRRSFPERVSD